MKISSNIYKLLLITSIFFLSCSTDAKIGKGNYYGKKFKVINTSGFSKSPITSIVSDEKGFIWCSTQNDGIFRISKTFEVDVFKMEFNQFTIFSLELTKNNQLLVGTSEGLMLYELTGEKRKPN